MLSSAVAARRAMVDCQIQTNGVVKSSVLEAFANVPRELFVPRDRQTIAYNDKDIVLAPGAYLLSPMTHARLIEIANLKPDDIVLSIGDVTGYGAAILSPQVMTVVALEGRVRYSEETRRIWSQLECNNVVALEGDSADGCPAHAPYSVIILHGAVAEIPPALLSQLSPGGRLVCVLQRPDAPVGTITVIECDEQGCYSHKSQFDAVAPWVDGMAPRRQFRF
ncbi:MAG: protein-L-isoaspartate O-methyltransferase [Micavibrio aeruginosavorus]|uniref:Protein-L-isoaspartate O-methyltransferase n=1 Tax=Micavibrio aeruginosavorus TaxID=349221 RepID=A0A7T5UFR7_9BACT|nr:MAG: protein-L-isoaspartate O-methyltransferase [Micavibrio aeruginosavorus]